MTARLQPGAPRARHRSIRVAPGAEVGRGAFTARSRHVLEGSIAGTGGLNTGSDRRIFTRPYWEERRSLREATFRSEWTHRNGGCPCRLEIPGAQGGPRSTRSTSGARRAPVPRATAHPSLLPIQRPRRVRSPSGSPSQPVRAAQRSTHSTKPPAVASGQTQARSNPPSQLVVHKADGTIEYEYTYGDDPFPPRS